jgi:hypothetical protein
MSSGVFHVNLDRAVLRQARTLPASLSENRISLCGRNAAIPPFGFVFSNGLDGSELGSFFQMRSLGQDWVRFANQMAISETATAVIRNKSSRHFGFVFPTQSLKFGFVP